METKKGEVSGLGEGIGKKSTEPAKGFGNGEGSACTQNTSREKGNRKDIMLKTNLS